MIVFKGTLFINNLKPVGDNRTDKYLNKIKNNRILAPIIVFGVVLGGLFIFWGQISPILPSCKKPVSEDPVVDAKLIVDRLSDSDFHFRFAITNKSNFKIKETYFTTSCHEFLVLSSVDRFTQVIEPNTSISYPPSPLDIKKAGNGFNSILLHIVYRNPDDKPKSCLFRFLIENRDLKLMEYDYERRDCGDTTKFRNHTDAMKANFHSGPR